MKTQKSIQKNMTEGNILPILLAFAIPVLFGNIVQQIYSLVDSVIVGQNLGANALASIGATDSLTYLFFGCTNGIATGFSICIAQAWGRKDEKDLKIYTALITKYCLIISFALAVILSITTPTILTFMNTPRELKANSSIYLIILFLGMPCSMGLNAVLAVLRAIGDSKISFYMLLISSFTNIGLDILFVAILHMGVAGAAFATVLAQFFVLCASVFYGWKKYPLLHFDMNSLKIKGTYRKLLFKNGIPMGAQVCITAVATMIVQIALNNCGTAYITAFTIGTKIQNILTQTFNALGMTMATFVGQNYGNGDVKRVRKGVRIGIEIGIGCSIFCIIFILLFLNSAISLFGSDVTDKVVSYTHYFMNCCMLGYIPLAFLFVFRSTLQGMGYAGITLIGGTCELIARALIVGLLAKPFGFYGISFGHTAAWTLAAVTLIPFYFSKIKKE